MLFRIIDLAIGQLGLCLGIDQSVPPPAQLLNCQYFQLTSSELLTEEVRENLLDIYPISRHQIFYLFSASGRHISLQFITLFNHVDTLSFHQH